MIPKILISPSIETRVGEIEKMVQSTTLIETDFRTHPDVLYFPSDSKLGISEARKIKEHLKFKPYQAKGRIVVLEDAANLTPEAQNGLLKTLEEPPENTVIILGASSDANFLPTILSRCEIVKLPMWSHDSTPDVETWTPDIEQLLKSDTSARFDYVEKLKDKESFLKALVTYFYQSLASNLEGNRTNTDFLKELLEAEKWAAQNVNIRGILEYLMLVMPQKK